MKAKVVAVGILLIIIVVIGLYEYQTWNGPLLHATYNLGDEIKGFPVSEMSLTICNVTTSKTILMQGVQDIGGGVGNQGQYAIVTVAVRNLEDNQVSFTKGSDISSTMRSLKFVLTDGDGKHQVNPAFYFLDSNKQTPVWEMGILMPNAQEVTTLAPHQTVYGYLYFIVGENYTPNLLQCIQGFNSNPNFAVNLKS